MNGELRRIYLNLSIPEMQAMRRTNKPGEKMRHPSSFYLHCPEFCTSFREIIHIEIQIKKTECREILSALDFGFINTHDYLIINGQIWNSDT